MSEIVNILTFDVEDWPQSTLNHALPITDRVRDNTLRILDLLGSAGVHGTFFVLGLVAIRFPELVRLIGDAGHEVALHGDDHRPVFAMSPDEFRADIRRSLTRVQDALGNRVLGYRAPDFSISVKSLWALSILADEGLVYDSSIFPFAGPRYGLPGTFRTPYRVRCAANPNFLEFPLATIELPGLRIPAAGGGYFRLFPYWVSAAAIRCLNRIGAPATTYFHPYEIDTREIENCSYAIPSRLRWMQGLRRASVQPKLQQLLTEFRWGPVKDRLHDGPTLTGGRYLHLADGPPSRPPSTMGSDIV